MSVDSWVKIQWEIWLDVDKELTMGFGVAEGPWKESFGGHGGGERRLEWFEREWKVKFSQIFEICYKEELMGGTEADGNLGSREIFQIDDMKIYLMLNGIL